MKQIIPLYIIFAIIFFSVMATPLLAQTSDPIVLNGTFIRVYPGENIVIDNANDLGDILRVASETHRVRTLVELTGGDVNDKVKWDNIFSDPVYKDYTLGCEEELCEIVEQPEEDTSRRDLLYQIKFSSGNADSFGIPVCTNATGSFYEDCTAEDETGEYHAVGITFLGEEWIISSLEPEAEVKGDTLTAPNMDEVAFHTFEDLLALPEFKDRTDKATQGTPQMITGENLPKRNPFQIFVDFIKKIFKPIIDQTPEKDTTPPVDRTPEKSEPDISSGGKLGGLGSSLICKDGFKEICLAKESSSGIVNAGDSLQLPDGNRVRLDDVASGATAETQTAELSVVDAQGNKISTHSVEPGTTQTLPTPDGSTYTVRVYKTAPGYTFGVKWADMAVIHEICTCEPRDTVRTSDPINTSMPSDNWMVSLNWKNRDITEKANTVILGDPDKATEADHLRTLIIYQGEVQNARNDLNPFVTDPVSWELEFEDLNLDDPDTLIINRANFKPLVDSNIERIEFNTTSAASGLDAIKVDGTAFQLIRGGSTSGTSTVDLDTKTIYKENSDIWTIPIEWDTTSGGKIKTDLQFKVNVDDYTPGSSSSSDSSSDSTSSILFKVNGNRVEMDGMNIGELHDNYVGSNLMVTSTPASGTGSTASIPNSYSSTGALVQHDVGSGTGWYYVTSISRPSSGDPFSGAQTVTVNWEAPLLPNDGWNPVSTSGAFALVPQGADIHVIANGALTLPGTFTVYNVATDQAVASTSISDANSDCSTPNQRCSANVATSGLAAGYYYATYSWQDGGTMYRSNSMALKVGSPSGNGQGTVTLKNAQTSATTSASWTPQYAQSHGTWGDGDSSSLNVFDWTTLGTPGISIGTSSAKRTYSLSSLGLTFTVDTDWSSYTTLTFSNGKTIALGVSGESPTITPSAEGDWGSSVTATVGSDGSLTLSTSGTTSTPTDTTANLTVSASSSILVPIDAIEATENSLPKYVDEGRPLIFFATSTLASNAVDSCLNVGFPSYGKAEGTIDYDKSSLRKMLDGTSTECPLRAVGTGTAALHFVDPE